MQHKEPTSNAIWTIPNLLSLLRLLMIPLLVWLYVFKEAYLGTLIVLLLSGATDILDGIIARKFNMVSDLGKALDPVADKLTQFSMLLCLLNRFPNMLALVCVLAVKEITAAVMGLLAIRKTHQVMGALWHGKLTTVVLYAAMALHIVWFSIPATVSNSVIGICMIVMLLSAILYTKRNIDLLRSR